MSTPSGEIQPVVNTTVPGTLFLADSNAADLHALAHALTAAGYIVIKVTEGQQLLALLDRLVPDAILLASELPFYSERLAPALPTSEPLFPTPAHDGGAQEVNADALHTYDGFTLSRLLSSTTEWLDIPTILLVPTEDPALRMRAIEVNAWGALAKPLHLPELSLLINRLIRRAQAQRNRTEEHDRLQSALQQQELEVQRLHAQRRQSEERVELLLTTVHAHSRQLNLLLNLALQNAGETHLLPRLRQQQFQQQVGTIQAFLTQLSKLVALLPSPQPLQAQSYELQPPQHPFRTHVSFSSPPPSGWPVEAEPQLSQPATSSSRCTTSEAKMAPITHLPVPMGSKRRIPQLSQLSEREYEVLIRLANGEGYDEIARYLEISSSTVRSYRSRIMHKLGITTATELIKFAVRFQLIDLS